VQLSKWWLTLLNRLFNSFVDSIWSNLITFFSEEFYSLPFEVLR
jgi:hypothetical protein